MGPKPLLNTAKEHQFFFFDLRKFEGEADALSVWRRNIHIWPKVLIIFILWVIIVLGTWF